MSRYAVPPITSSAKFEQRVEDVVGAAQRFGSGCPAHSREVRIDPPQPRNAVENQLEASLSLAVVDAGAVEYQHGSTGPVLHVVDHHLAHSDLHPSKLPAQEASRQRGLDRGSRCRPALEWAPVILSTAGSCVELQHQLGPTTAARAAEPTEIHHRRPSL
jgi:hypothetical protein